MNQDERIKAVPIWQKSNLTLEEAAAYTGIGINKLRDMSNDESCQYVLWVGTNSGVLAYSLRTSTPRWHRTSETLAGQPTRTVNVLHLDQKGSLWAGTVNGGLHRYEPSFDRFDAL